MPDNERTSRGHIFRPLHRFKPVWRVEIKYDGDSSYTDITSYCVYTSVAHSSREALSTGTIKLEDINAALYQLITGGEDVRVYLGYKTAAYLELQAKVTKTSLNFQPTTGYSTKLSVMAYPEMRSKKLSYSFDNTLLEDAIGTILGNFSDVSYTAPGVSTDRISFRFVSADAMSMIKEICEKYGLEFFINSSGVANLFYAADNEITHDAIVLNQNLLSITEFGRDLSRMRNRVKIFGKQENFVMWLREAKDEDLIDDYWQMDEEIFDSAITTNEDAQDRANKELAFRKAYDEQGRFKCIGMANLQPGKQIWCAIPPLLNAKKTIRSLSHRLGDGWLTHFTIETTPYSMTRSILEKDKQIKGLQSIPLNKIYDESIVIDMDNDATSLALGGLTITDGRLRTEATAPSNGTFEVSTSSDFLSVSADVTSAIVVVDGVNLESSVFYVSNDGESTELSFQDTELETEQKSFSTINNIIRIRGTIDDVDSTNEVSIRRIAVYFKHE